MNHLTDEQIRDYRSGDLGQEAILHIQECETCRSHVFEERILDTLIGQALAGDETETLSEHPGEDQLLLFVEAGLDAYQSTQVEAHLRDCERCTARVLALHRSGYEVAAIEPPASLVAQVRQQVRMSVPRQNLGQLFLETVDRVIARLAFRPSGLFSGNAMTGGLAAASPVGALKETIADYGSVPAMTLTAGTFTLSFEGKRKGSESVIVLSVSDVATYSPVANLAIEVIAEAGEIEALRTDTEGRCRLGIPLERSQLIIHTEPAFQIELNPVAV